MAKVKAEAIIRVKPEYEVKPEMGYPIPKIKPKIPKKVRRYASRSSESSEEEPIMALPVIMPRIVPVMKVDFAGLSDPEKESEFWKDVTAVKARGTAYVAKMDEARREYFKATYFKYYDMMLERLQFDEMFTRNGIDSLMTQSSIVSYAIGEGREVFDNLFADLDLFQNIIIIEEYTNFENKLPVDMQH
jgi:hypothetical protein